MTETQTNNPAPKEVRDFIKYLSDIGLYKLYDIQKGVVYYNATSQSKLPIDFVKDQFKKDCKTSKWVDYSNYVIASIEAISGTYFKPNGTKLVKYGLGEQKLNTYRSYKPKSEESDCPLFIEFLERLFPNEEERHISTQWLSHMLQKPQERPSWHLLLSSDVGTGKGFLFGNILTPLLMKQTILCASYSAFITRFSTALDSTLLCLLDDPKESGDSTMTQLKSKLSEEIQTIERKKEQEFSQRVYTRVILASNEYRALKVDESERRWYVPQRIEHKASKEETQQFIAKLDYWLSNENGLDAIYKYLTEYSLEGFNHKHIKQTDTLLNMIESSTPVLLQDVSDWLEGNPVFKWESYCGMFDAPSDLLKKYIIELGYGKKKTDLLGEGKRSNWWIPKNTTVKEAKLLLNRGVRSIPF